MMAITSVASMVTLPSTAHAAVDVCEQEYFLTARAVTQPSAAGDLELSITVHNQHRTESCVLPPGRFTAELIQSDGATLATAATAPTAGTISIKPGEIYRSVLRTKKQGACTEPGRLGFRLPGRPSHQVIEQRRIWLSVCDGMTLTGFGK